MPKRKIRIGINARGLAVTAGGAKEYVRKLVTMLPEQLPDDYEFWIYTDRKHPKVQDIVYKQPNVHWRVHRGGKLGRSDFFGITALIWDQLILPFRMKRDQIDLAIFPKNIVPKLYKGRSIVCIMDLAHYYSGLNAYKPGDSLYMRRLIPSSLKRADAILCISKHTRDDVVRMIDQKLANKIKVIYLAGAYDYRSINNAVNVREKYDLGTTPYIFFSGSLSPRKNIQRTLKAVAAIKDQIPHKFVVTGGKSWNDSDIPSLVKDLGLKDRMVKLGFVPDEDMPHLFAQADIYIHPSLYEGFGMTVLEAFSAGCPVITSGVSSLPEVAGDAAILVDPLDETEISQAVLRITSKRKFREQLIQKGYEQLEKFSWEKTVRETVSAIESVIER